MTSSAVPVTRGARDPAGGDPLVGSAMRPLVVIVLVLLVALVRRRDPR